MSFASDISLSFRKTVNIVFKGELESAHRQTCTVDSSANQQRSLPGSGLPTSSKESQPTLSPKDYCYLWEEARRANKVTQLWDCFVKVTNEMFHRLTHNTLSDKEKANIVNFLCDCGVIEMQVTTTKLFGDDQRESHRNIRGSTLEAVTENLPQNPRMRSMSRQADAQGGHEAEDTNFGTSDLSRKPQEETYLPQVHVKIENDEIEVGELYHAYEDDTAESGETTVGNESSNFQVVTSAVRHQQNPDVSADTLGVDGQGVEPGVLAHGREPAVSEQGMETVIDVLMNQPQHAHGHSGNIRAHGLSSANRIGQLQEDRALKTSNTTGSAETSSSSHEAGVTGRDATVSAPKRGKLREPKLINGLLHCPFCRRTFKTRVSFNRHIVIHNVDRPYECTRCDMSYKRLVHLTEHMRVHTGEKPYLCEVCGRAFARSTYRAVHMRTHTGVKPYHCQLCGMKFSQKQILNSHLKRHSSDKPFTCTDCGKRFRTQRDMQSHMLIHTNRKHFKCELCSKKFLLEKSLEGHMRIHTGEKPFKCVRCGLCFRHKVQLDNHAKQSINCVQAPE
ncbi:uncharacterized protein [Ptychodera flava]|uniref:uncharacterized protein n=1 Tax=Ptychodera flava TaxID=63121 RepID=UPI00396A5F53